ncbi:hypothetical protein EVAR_5800_1 [Eumeta japonica]|uniref:Uncharacterized protein n=1 Tax=Eumeta variegata TaxID=151549 RepID=A0A4C1T5A8_EUMVA|nr:hypothetical protein EVAR_5800_1 [Eumeta japonica]
MGKRDCEPQIVGSHRRACTLATPKEISLEGITARGVESSQDMSCICLTAQRSFAMLQTTWNDCNCPSGPMHIKEQKIVVRYEVSA